MPWTRQADVAIISQLICVEVGGGGGGGCVGKVCTHTTTRVPLTHARVGMLCVVQADVFVASPSNYRDTSQFSHLVVDERHVRGKDPDTTVYCCDEGNVAVTESVAAHTHDHELAATRMLTLLQHAPLCSHVVEPGAGIAPPSRRGSPFAPSLSSALLPRMPLPLVCSWPSTRLVVAVWCARRRHAAAVLALRLQAPRTTTIHTHTLKAMVASCPPTQRRQPRMQQQGAGANRQSGGYC